MAFEVIGFSAPATEISALTERKEGMDCTPTKKGENSLKTGKIPNSTPLLQLTGISSDKRNKLSLLDLCRTCTFMCCNSGTPLVSAEEVKEIVRRSGFDYFKKIQTENGEEYFIIGYKKDGSERDLSQEPCPYLAEDRTCSIHAFKPLDCVLYPLKPFYRTPENVEAEWVLDERCPAMPHLSSDFLSLAIELGQKFLKRFGPAILAHYVKHFNPWAITRGVPWQS